MNTRQQRIADRLRAHLVAGGTMNDNTTEVLYKEWHRLPQDAETTLEDIEAWVQDVAQ